MLYFAESKLAALDFPRSSECIEVGTCSTGRQEAKSCATLCCLETNKPNIAALHREAVKTVLPLMKCMCAAAFLGNSRRWIKQLLGMFSVTKHAT